MVTKEVIVSIKLKGEGHHPCTIFLDKDIRVSDYINNDKPFLVVTRYEKLMMFNKNNIVEIILKNKYR